MSPVFVRRYRAERLLRREFEAMRGRVLARVRLRLRATGVSLDTGDLEACYAQAWHGLYTTMLEGRGPEVSNPEAWLALVTYRRAIDEHRSHGARVTPVGCAGAIGDARAKRERRPMGDAGAMGERDLAGELDERARLRQLMEGLRARLSPRERQAAALCYLQGLSRAQAAGRMGVSQARMRKLMDGPRAGSPGVAGKVGELLDAIRAGSYCAEQSSLMRGFAFGILDPAGERYALALAHQRECPACRAHVLSLRGMAAVLPPLPLPLVLGAGVAAGAAGGAGAGAGVSTGAGASTGASGGVGAGGGACAGGAGTAAGVSGAGMGVAAGVSGAGAGGGWLMAGGLGAKLAAGCLLAVGVGAGCVALTVAPILPGHAAPHRRDHARADLEHVPIAYQAPRPAPTSAQPILAASSAARARAYSASDGRVRSRASNASIASTARASREFGPERSISQSSSGSLAVSGQNVARAASTEPQIAQSSSQASPQSQPQTRTSGGPSAAAREFGLG
jgi:DNA-directed RNA polymerase specialized sigma24 family protein